jgi:hypothetical protein
MAEFLYRADTHQLIGLCLLVNFGADSLEWQRVVL